MDEKSHHNVWHSHCMAYDLKPFQSNINIIPKFKKQKSALVLSFKYFITHRAYINNKRCLFEWLSSTFVLSLRAIKYLSVMKLISFLHFYSIRSNIYIYIYILTFIGFGHASRIGQIAI